MSRSKRSSGAAPVYAAIPYVSLASPRGCDLFAPGHQCHSIQASQGLQAANHDVSLAVGIRRAEVITLDGVEVTVLTLDSATEQLGRFVHHDPGLVGRLITGSTEPYIWEPTFQVLFGLTDAQREGLDAGAISLIAESDFTACRTRSDQ